MKKYKLWLLLGIIISIIIIILVIKGSNRVNNNLIDNDSVSKNLIVTSSAFTNGGFIPSKYTGHGEDISVPVTLSNVDLSGKSIAIIMDDPDAPTSSPFVHWLIWNIPINTTIINEGIKTNGVIASLGNAIQGKNGFNKIGYKGPNPPSGTHTYMIKVYVLDEMVDLKSGSSKTQLESSIKSHIIQYGLLEGKYSK